MNLQGFQGSILVVVMVVIQSSRGATICKTFTDIIEEIEESMKAEECSETHEGERERCLIWEFQIAYIKVSMEQFGCTAGRGAKSQDGVKIDRALQPYRCFGNTIRELRCEFVCKVGSRDRVLNTRLVCNDVADCEDKEDEKYCKRRNWFEEVLNWLRNNAGDSQNPWAVRQNSWAVAQNSWATQNPWAVRQNSWPVTPNPSTLTQNPWVNRLVAAQNRWDEVQNAVNVLGGLG